MRERIITSPHFELQFDPVHRIQFAKFIGDVPDKQYQLFWEKEIQHALSENVNRVLLDQRYQGNISALARGWAVANAFPKIQQNFPSDLAAAVIMAKKLHERPAIQYLVATFRRMTSYTIEIFQNEEEAVQWLSSANELPESIKNAS